MYMYVQYIYIYIYIYIIMQLYIMRLTTRRPGLTIITTIDIIIIRKYGYSFIIIIICYVY